MNLGSMARAVATFLILVLLHYTLRPLLGWRAPMDFLLLALLLSSIRVRPAVGALIGLALGIVSDSLTPDALGAGAIAMTVVGYLASWLKAVFFADDVVLNALFFFCGKWAFDVIVLLAAHQMAGGALLVELLVWSPLKGVVTALFGLLTLLILRPILRAPAT